MPRGFSAIVLGAGHNGLVAANYLARAGAKVLVLERRALVGGACVTEELIPGFRVSSCAYVCHLLQDKIIEDLDLRRHGLEIYPLAPYRLQPFPDGRHFLAWPDDARTLEEIRRLSPEDAESYPAWTAFWRRASGILHRHFLTDPPALAEVAASARGTPDEEVLDRMLAGNMKDLVEEHFASELIRAAFIEAHDAGDVRAPGSILSVAYIKCNQFTAPANLGIPRGGMGAITQAMARAARAQGVEIRTGVEVERIAVRDGRASGVVAAGEGGIEADVILSNADPKRTFLRLLDPGALEPAFLESVRRLKTTVSCLKLHCALRGLPDFSRYLGEGHDPRHLAQMRICPSVAYFEQSWEEAKAGRPTSCPVMYVQIPTVYDPTLAPPGQHVMSVWSLYAPVRLREGTWEAARERAGEHLIETLALYAPDIREAIIDWSLFTPWDLERRAYLTDGNIRHLDIIPQQMWTQRPSYRTPIRGLYLCGAGTHPGGEVTGAPGHNAARAALRDWERKPA